MENEKLKKALETITFFSKKFPEKEFEEISRYRDEAIPYLLKAVRKAIEEKDELPENYQLHFYALFLLAQFGCQEAFPLIIEMVSLPSEVVESLIGDAATESLKDILFSTYDGNEELILNFIKNTGICEYCRAAGLDVLNQRFYDGDIEKDKMISFLKNLIYEPADSEDWYFDTKIMEAACQCHFIEMLPDIRFLFEEDRIDESICGGYESSIDLLFDYREKYQTGCSKITDAARCLKGWAMFDQPNKSEKKSADKAFEKMMKDAIRKINHVEKKVKIGRNDPCPCGSGKKYKFCCINKPVKPVEPEAIESDAEQAKWLDDYPLTGVEHIPGRIYLEDYFDEESIAIDKLLYLALKHRPGFITYRETDEQMEQRQVKYLWKAFELFHIKCEKEGLKDPEEYDARHMIHYSAKSWLNDLGDLLKRLGMTKNYKETAKYLGH